MLDTLPDAAFAFTTVSKQGDHPNLLLFLGFPLIQPEKTARTQIGGFLGRGTGSSFLALTRKVARWM